VHSATKYLNGHSDMVGGVAIVGHDEELGEKLAFLQNAVGAISGPFDSFLALRGLKTLALRMERHCASALKIAQFLEAHARVEAVIYPGLASHPQHAVARRQMTGFGGMLSIQVRGGRDAAFAVADKVRIFTCATSFGGTESLLEHRASVEGAATRSPDDLLRLSIGLEHPDDLVEDLVQALG
jgi:cystathionine gamma-lyase